MSLEILAQSYKLVPITVNPGQLFLDPNNPRISYDLKLDRLFTFEETLHPKIQKYIRDALDKSSNRVAALIKGIQSTGFTYGGGKITVQLLAKKKYLVLEGNRRTAAIQHLLEAPGKLSTYVAGTLENLEVSEFIYQPRRGHSETAAKAHLMRLHMDQALAWGALPTARYAYECYMQALARKCKTAIFQYDLDCINQVAELFNCTLQKVRKQLKIYRIYAQLESSKYEVQSDHYSLIELAVTDRALSADYFGLSPDGYQFSYLGLSKFNQLCIINDCPIKNPSDFKRFSEIFRFGHAELLSYAEGGQVSLDQIRIFIKRKLAANGLLDELTNILTLIETLKVDTFADTVAEKQKILRIKELVDRTLYRLC